MAPTSFALLEAVRHGTLTIPKIVPDSVSLPLKRYLEDFVREHAVFDVTLPQSHFGTLDPDITFGGEDFEFFPGEAAAICVRLQGTIDLQYCILCTRPAEAELHY
jgi:hypothetical protein